MSYIAPMVVKQRNVSTAHVVIAWVLCVLTLGYLLPWAIAATRDKQATISIFLVNLFLGWSFVGWWWSLIWSVMSDPSPVVVTPVLAAAPVYHPVAAIPVYQQPVYQQPQPQYQQPQYQQPQYEQPRYQQTAFEPDYDSATQLALPPAHDTSSPGSAQPYNQPSYYDTYGA